MWDYETQIAQIFAEIFSTRAIREISG